MGKVIGLALVLFSFIWSYNKIQEILKNKNNERLLKEAQLRKQQQYLNDLKGYSAIRNYTICLSLDYKVNRSFSDENKVVINKVIYAKISELLLKSTSNIQIKNLQDVLIIMSEDFNIYDKIYDNILKILSKIKTEVDDRYSISMIPTITTDAYMIKPDMTKVKTNHFNIKHCNFTGTSCSSAAFSKKYKFLNKNKYMGTPIGEYSIVDKERENSYELNIIHKNLVKQLESVGR